MDFDRKLPVGVFYIELPRILSIRPYEEFQWVIPNHAQKYKAMNKIDFPIYYSRTSFLHVSFMMSSRNEDRILSSYSKLFLVSSWEAMWDNGGNAIDCLEENRVSERCCIDVFWMEFSQLDGFRPTVTWRCSPNLTSSIVSIYTRK